MQASENGATQEEATLAESGYISEEAAGGVGGGDASKAEVSDRHEAAASHVATLDAAEAVAGEKLTSSFVPCLML